MRAPVLLLVVALALCGAVYVVLETDPPPRRESDSAGEREVESPTRVPVPVDRAVCRLAADGVVHGNKRLIRVTVHDALYDEPRAARLTTLEVCPLEGPLPASAPRFRERRGSLEAVERNVVRDHEVVVLARTVDGCIGYARCPVEELDETGTLTVEVDRGAIVMVVVHGREPSDEVELRRGPVTLARDFRDIHLSWEYAIVPPGPLEVLLWSGDEERLHRTVELELGDAELIELTRTSYSRTWKDR